MIYILKNNSRLYKELKKLITKRQATKYENGKIFWKDTPQKDIQMVNKHS